MLIIAGCVIVFSEYYRVNYWTVDDDNFCDQWTYVYAFVCLTLAILFMFGCIFYCLYLIVIVVALYPTLVSRAATSRRAPRTDKKGKQVERSESESGKRGKMSIEMHYNP